jgi:hypothetical protein
MAEKILAMPAIVALPGVFGNPLRTERRTTGPLMWALWYGAHRITDIL